MADTNRATNSQGKPVTKKERREIAREKARILREQEEKRKKRNRTLAVFGGVIGLVLIIFAIMQIFGNDKADFDGEVRPAELANVTDDYGIDIDENGAAGSPVPDAGLFSVYSDYTCSGCIHLETASAENYRNLTSSGQMALRFYPVATLGNDISSNMAAAMFYVATYAPEQAFAFNEALFDQAYTTVIKRGPAPSETDIAEIAASVGVPADVVADLPASISSDDWQTVTDEATDAFRAKGYSGTPTLEVNGEENTAWLENGDVASVMQLAIDAGAPEN
ncbi:hypothetical protein J2S70_000778 [Trueperella bonasi]|uniref:Thioredoxin-like fold domain-containing protein n=1 Tax=Trueperella bonasi TaxID=312286 RepID=A0ABT9NFN3_9ACTO|nr:thioredoxin domain-containing protein [Trueperella bonasi]MDP9806196.1 hypothetical protein [Trueperella bonasi]